MRFSSLLWISGWSTPNKIWNEQVAFFPSTPHYFIDFTDCRIATKMKQKVEDTLLSTPSPVCIVAWSMGACLALEIAGTLGKNISAIFVVGATPSFVRTKEYPFGWDKRVLARMKKQLTAEPTKVLAKFNKRIFSPTEQADAMKWDLLLKQHEPSLASLNCGLDYLASFTFDKQSIPTSLPIHILSGDHDSITPHAGAIHLHKMISHSTFHTLKTGHAPFWTQPVDFSNWIKKHMKDENL